MQPEARARIIARISWLTGRGQQSDSYIAGSNHAIGLFWPPVARLLLGRCSQTRAFPAVSRRRPPACLRPRGSSSAARSTQREQISALGVADVGFRMQLSMEETTPASPSTGMGSSARSCARSRLPSSGAHGRSDCRSGRSRGNACCVVFGLTEAVGVHPDLRPGPPRCVRRLARVRCKA